MWDQSIVEADGSVGILPVTNWFETRDRAGGLFSQFQEGRVVQDREEQSIAASQSHSRRLRNLDPLLKCFRRVSPELFSRRLMESGGEAALPGPGDILK
jgi:hypothetical protein